MALIDTDRLEGLTDREHEPFRTAPYVSNGSDGLIQAVAATLQAVYAALQPDEAAVRIVLPDRAGRLRQAAAVDNAAGVTVGKAASAGRKRSERRWVAYRTGTTIHLRLRSSPGYELAIVPLRAGETVIGLVEVVASDRTLASRWEGIEDVLDQASSLLQEGRDRDELKRERNALSAARLARSLIRARSPRAAVQAVLSYYFEQFEVPVAAWLSADSEHDSDLVGVRGLGSRKRKQIRQKLRTIPPAANQSAVQQWQVCRIFSDIAVAQDVAVLRVRDALLLAGGVSPSLKRSLHTVGPLLEDAFDHLASLRQAEHLRENLDLGMAHTAHELRGPLVAANAAIDSILQAPGDRKVNENLLLRSSRELQHLAHLIDSLVRWASGRGSLHFRRIDIVELVKDVVDGCRLESGETNRVAIRGPSSLQLRADPDHLRGAIANVLRNAMIYSPPTSPVRVAVESAAGEAIVSVRDEGPGVPPEEQSSIFFPLVRGKAGRHNRQGAGLGLFITKRVVEAHRGRVWVESNGTGATFRIELPLR